jgi:hypothetical protein
MAKLTIICIGIVCVLLAATVLGIWIHTTLGKRKEKKRVQSACASGAASSTTFVTLVSYKNAAGTAATLHSLFEKAQCPLRIYVGVVEVYAPGETSSVLDEYESLVRFSKSPFCLKSHVRVIKMPTSEYRGSVAAHAQAERFLYRKEKYVCTITAHAELAPQWEMHCAAALEQHQKLKKGDSVVLTAVLPATEKTLAAPGIRTPGTYTAFSKHGGLLAYFLKKMLPAVYTVPAVAWCSDFSFTYGSRVALVPYDMLPVDTVEGSDTTNHDFYMTLALTGQGWQLAHPPFLVGVRTVAHAGESTCPPELWYRQCMAVCKAKQFRSVDSVLASFARPGFLPKVTSRLQLGLSPHPATDEIEMKLGSMGEFYSILSRLELQLYK